MTELTPEDEKLENEELSTIQSFNKMPVEMARLKMWDEIIGAFADIAYSDDVSIDTIRKKARRIYFKMFALDQP